MTSKTRFTIRPAQSDDLDACLRLSHQVETQTIWQMALTEEAERTHITFQTMRLPRPVTMDYPRSPEELRQEFSGEGVVLIAEAESVLLGYIQVKFTPSDHLAWVRNMAVDEPYRRRRIGRILLSQAREWAQLHQARRLTVETTTRNYPAIQFVQSQGYVFCGFNDRYYTNQDIAVFFGQNL